MSKRCKGCGALFGTHFANVEHRLQIITDSGLMVGGSYCRDCYGPLVTALMHELGQAGSKLRAA